MPGPWAWRTRSGGVRGDKEGGRASDARNYSPGIPADSFWAHPLKLCGEECGTIDFISSAPRGPEVSIYTGEGFVSKRCGS